MNFKKFIEDIKESIKTPLPPAIQKLKYNRIIFSIIIFIVCIAAAIGFKSIGFLVGIIISLYLVIMAFKLNYDCAKGEIEQYEGAFVTSTVNHSGHNVVFMDDNEKTFSLLYPSKKMPFDQTIKYRLYVEKSTQIVIIAYENI